MLFKQYLIRLMAEDDGQTGGGTPPPAPGDDLMQQLKDLKSKMINRDEFDKVKAERDRLIMEMMSAGVPLDTGDKAKDKPAKISDEDFAKKTEELANKLYGPTGDALSNREYAKAVLELRKVNMEHDGWDPFVAPVKKAPMVEERSSKDISNEMETAEKVATILQQCIDLTEDNPSDFTAEFYRRIGG